eukprot:gene3195-13213_t
MIRMVSLGGVGSVSCTRPLPFRCSALPFRRSSKATISTPVVAQRDTRSNWRAVARSAGVDSDASINETPGVDGEEQEQQQDEMSPMGRAASMLKSFCNAFPEFSDEVLGLLLTKVPPILSTPKEEVRSKFKALSSAMGVSLVTAAKLVGKAPVVWEWPVETTMEKLGLIATALSDIPLGLVTELVVAQPTIWALDEVHLIADRVDTLSGRLGLPVEDMVRLISKQPMLWAVNDRHIRNNVPAVASALGLTIPQAADMVARMPVVIAVEPNLLRLEVVGLSATMGVPLERLLQLMQRCLGLVSVPAEIVGANVENIRLVLDVAVEDVLDLVVKQPTLLCTQLGNIDMAMSSLCAVLPISRSQALALLTREPALLYDLDEGAIQSRLEALAAAFETPAKEIAALIPSVPSLLVIAPSTIKACLDVFRTQLLRSPKDCLQLVVQDTASFLMLGPQANAETVEQWSSRLQISPQMVSRLIREQPALLDLSPTTVKARLETLSALFGVPLEITIQLVLKHPALAVIPPNTTITRVKGIQPGS